MKNYDYTDVEGGGRRNRGQEMALQDRTSNIYVDPNRPTPASVSDMLNEMDKKLAEQSRKMKLGFWVLGFFSLVLIGALTYLLIYSFTNQLTTEPMAFSCHTLRLVS